MQPAYTTTYGKAYCGDALDLFDLVGDETIQLAITSPPFALQRKKDYGNKEQHEYVEWLAQFAEKLKDKLTHDGSFVLDLGGAYKKGVPVRSLYNYRVLIHFCEELGYHLAEEFFWFNPSKLPSPIEWVNKRKIRAKDAVNTIWWFSKSEYPKADVSKVLVPYSDRMKKLLKDQARFYTPKERPSGHDISNRFGKNNGGAIPSNLLQIPNTESNSQYLRFCREANVKPHPARFPVRLPDFFINFLTDPGDLVLDFFAGSNATGQAAESLHRRWMAFEIDANYVAASSFRFLEDEETSTVRKLYQQILDGEHIHISSLQPSLFA